MLDLKELNWDPQVVGELDHQKVNAPYVRLMSYNEGDNGDIVYVYDLRVTCPNNEEYLDTKVLHSFEHLLLAGFRKYLGRNFINVAPMGCQTGFYLVCLNFGNKENLYQIYEYILLDIIEEESVPYANIKECGQYVYHDLESSKELAQYLLDKKDSWDKVL